MRFRHVMGLLLAASVLSAQNIDRDIDRIAGIPKDDDARDALASFFRSRVVLQAVRESVQETARRRAESSDSGAARLRAGSALMFRETGGTDLRSGSTTAVAKTSATEFLSMAIESGSITSKTDNSSATFHINALPTWQLATGRGAPYGCGGLQTRKAGTGVCESGPGFWLRGLTSSVSFNVNSKETAIPNIATTGTNQTIVSGIRVLTNPSKLSAFGWKYELFQRERDPKEQSKKLKIMADALSENLTTSGLALKLASAMDKIIQNGGTEREEYKKWVADSVEGAIPIRKDRVALKSFVSRRLNLIVTQLLTESAKDLSEDVQKIQILYDSYVSAMAKLEAEQLFKKSAAFDFVHSRPTDQPFLDTIRLDLNTPLGRKGPDNQTGAAASLDFNAAFSIYHTAQILNGKTIRLRDASASMALNYRMPSWGDLGSPVLTLAGYYQYMFNDGLIQFKSDAFTPGASNIALRGPALQVLNTKGSIGIGQLRLEIPLGKDSGLTFPLGFSYANRTELVKDPNRKYWQGHIGLSYDLSKLQESFLKGK